MNMEEQQNNRSFLGTGWAFPPVFSREKGGVNLSSDLEDINQSLAILLSTRPGERVMRPDFGCNLDRLLFEPLNISLATYVEDIVKTAILYHEPRILPQKVLIRERQEDPGTLDIIVDYEVRSTNTRYNFIYPFYLNESADNRQA
jgi:phage baseplate assembly protein W